MIRSKFSEPKGTPIQPGGAKGSRGEVEVYDQYVGGLADLEGFSHVILLYHFHLSGPSSLMVRPFLDKQARGVFSTRAPARPNPIGLSAVRLERVEGNRLFVRDLDVVDKTPLLDIKPHVPQFEPPGPHRTGWLENRVSHLGGAADDGRFLKPEEG